MRTVRKWGMVSLEGAIGNLLENATSEVDCLMDEVETWKSGMEGTNLESTSKYAMLDEASGSLSDASDSLEECKSMLEELTQGLDGVTLKYAEFRKRYSSRALRLNNALNMLYAIQVHFEELLADLDRAANEETHEQFEAFQTSLGDAVDSLEGVEFPGMFG